MADGNNLSSDVCRFDFDRGSSPKLPQKKIEIQRDHTSQGWRGEKQSEAGDFGHDCFSLPSPAIFPL